MDERLEELLDELEGHLRGFGYYGPLLTYARKVDAGELEWGDPQPIECGNSGTTMRLLAGWLAGQGNFYRALEQMGRPKVQELCGLLEERVRRG